MKVAITGKGGVGKTTLSSILARLYADEGRTVLAADVDPDANLGLALGFTEEEVNSITPISKMRKLVEERTGANSLNKFFKLNPQVSDIPDTYAREINGVKLLVMGTVETGGSGCVCPEHVMLKAILSSLIFRKDDVVIMDMEAGLEHLGRGTASMMDQFIVVIEPGARSIQTYQKVKQLAADLGITRVRVVANKVRNADDEAFLKARIPEDALLGFIHYDADVIDADRRGMSPYDLSARTVDEIRAIKARIDSELEENMEHVRDIVVLGRSARNESGIKNRQPIGEMYVKAPFAIPDFYKEVILDELNVKTLTMKDDVSAYSGSIVKPNFNAIRANHGGDKIGPVRAALSQMDGDEIVRKLKADGVLKVQAGDETVDLTEADLLIEAKEVEGFTAATDGRISVVLDKHLTPELIEEGFVREIVSKVQTMRKEAGFEVMDRIAVYAAGSGRIREVMERNGEGIRKDVLADDIIFAEPEGYTKDWKINGEAVTLGVKKQ